MNYTGIGDAVNTAARICSEARPGDIVLGESTFGEVGNMVNADQMPATKLKGKDQKVELFRVRGLRRRSVHPTLRETDGPPQQPDD